MNEGINQSINQPINQSIKQIHCLPLYAQQYKQYSKKCFYFPALSTSPQESTASSSPVITTRSGLLLQLLLPLTLLQLYSENYYRYSQARPLAVVDVPCSPVRRPRLQLSLLGLGYYYNYYYH